MLVRILSLHQAPGLCVRGIEIKGPASIQEVHSRAGNDRPLPPSPAATGARGSKEKERGRSVWGTQGSPLKLEPG